MPSPVPEEEALLTAILRNPLDDTARLIYADWLEEHHNSDIECTECEYVPAVGRNMVIRSPDSDSSRVRALRFYSECRLCKGVGRIDNRYRDRAEFIRMSIEAATNFDWRLDERLSQVTDPVILYGLYDIPDRNLLRAVSLNLRRGFVGHVGCRTSRFFDFVPFQGYFLQDAHLGSYPILVRDVRRGVHRLFDRYPISEVSLTDCTPARHGTRPADIFWSWSRLPEGQTASSPDQIHCELYKWLPGGKEWVQRVENVLRPRRQYVTERDAYADLSAACVGYGRDAVNLPYPRALLDQLREDYCWMSTRSKGCS